MADTPTPTRGELTVLRALWTHGASTVREVHTALASKRSVAYTTTLKTLQVMTAKGLTVREERGTQHLYRARHSEGQMQRRLLRELLDRAFGGSTSRLVLQALATKRASKEELAEIRRLIGTHSGKESDHD